MKITAQQLRSIIKEEVSKVLLEYEQSVVRRGDELFKIDDEGNEEFYDDVEGSQYDWLQDGEATPLERSSYRPSIGSAYGRRRGRY